MPPDPSLPPTELLHEQAAWLAPARSRLLRRVRVAARRRILDLGCGPGAVSGELAARGAGCCTVVALDRSREALAQLAVAARVGADARTARARVCPIRAAAHRLPFADGVFDLVFCQFTLMWLDAPAAIAEMARVLQPGGAVAAIEPDYGGMIEYPPDTATRELWIAGLNRAGADPEIGRRLPGLLIGAGFRVHVGLLDRLAPPSARRFSLLRGLPLTPGESHRLGCIEERAAACNPRAIVAHLPVLLLTAELH
jgi:SAM-dependent methyltransferase